MNYADECSVIDMERGGSLPARNCVCSDSGAEKTHLDLQHDLTLLEKHGLDGDITTFTKQYSCLNRGLVIR
jgi:hypothetical protein